MTRLQTSIALPLGTLAAVLSAAALAAGAEPSDPATSAAAPGPSAEARTEDAKRTVVRSTFFPAPESDEGPTFGEAELAPLFEAEPFRTARARLEANRPAEALALIPAAVAKTPPERYLRALALLRADQYAPAAAAFAALIDDYPPLANRCRYSAGLALEGAREFGRAAAMFREVGADSAVGPDAQWSLARVLQASGDVKGAIAVLAPTADRPAPQWGWDAPGDALYEVAQMQLSLGDRKAAGASFLKVWAEHPRARNATQALERARALKTEPTAADKIARGELLMEDHKNKPAIDLLAPIVESPPKDLSDALLCRAKFAMGKAYRKQREHAKAIALLESVVDKCAHDDVWARAAYIGGTSASIIDLEKGVRFYRILAEELPDHPFADDALFFAAELLMRLDRNDEARVALQRLAKAYPAGDYRAEGLFKLFWLERSEKRLEQGLAALDRIERDYAGTTEGIGAVERARYWRARTLADLGRHDEAVDAYEQVVLKHPASFYATLARSRIAESAAPRAAVLLARLSSAPQPPAETSRPAGRLASDPRFLAGLELLRMGFYPEAQAELLSIDRARLRDVDPPYGLRLMVELLVRAGQTRMAHAVARTHLRRDLAGPFDPATVPTWQAAFPLLFRDPIEKHSQTAGIDPDLLQALIREESALDPNIHSWAGAIGLCQLMPPTARQVAHWLKIKGRLSPDRLHNPDLNIQLGATYLSALIKQFRGNVALSLAAYNAGGGAVNNWIRSSGTRNLDEFVEDIPIQETRNYVKRVMGSYATYQLLYGRGSRASVVGALIASN